MCEASQLALYFQLQSINSTFITQSDIKEEFHKQLEEVLLWYEEKIFPLLSASSEKWLIMKNNKTRKRRRGGSLSDEDGSINSSRPHVQLIHSLIEVLR